MPPSSSPPIKGAVGQRPKTTNVAEAKSIRCLGRLLSPRSYRTNVAVGDTVAAAAVVIVRKLQVEKVRIWHAS
jgi:hypothetical protein